MRAQLQYLLLDGFDPDTGDLALRVGLLQEDGEGPEVLRVKLLLGRTGDSLHNLKRELQTHVQVPLPQLWERGLKVIIHAIEEELGTPAGRNPARYTWVQTQVMHPTDPRQSTLSHPVPEQATILWEWSQRMERQGSLHRAMEFLERLILMAPTHTLGLGRLSSLLRQAGMIEESLPLLDRLVALKPEDPECRIRRGEALLHLDRATEALEAFQSVLKLQPMNALAHLGAGQARSLEGRDPLPHLDAALELDREGTLSVLRETFDYRLLARIPHETYFPIEDLPSMLGVSGGELRRLVQQLGLPVTPEGRVREPELSRWVLVQNRYQLLPLPLHWMAPTPRRLPDLA